ncbi:unnamed protein product [Cuscuta campestris]|uniref:Uncharacterized protein n=1 Tax=Cuscuta campestris TaxID=132261 RepID=A0A484L4D4_9ASTE|nr:unnamed protein product [Cuscuta campestris]
MNFTLKRVQGQKVKGGGKLEMMHDDMGPPLFKWEKVQSTLLLITRDGGVHVKDGLWVISKIKQCSHF